jgi:thiol-disulfide isomerase/thioredoxin
VRTPFLSLASCGALGIAAVLAVAVPAADARLSEVTDLAGRRVEALPLGTGPLVLVFTATECPLSNRYAPELRRLRSKFAGRGVDFRLVYADDAETEGAIRGHLRAFGLGDDALRDRGQELVRLTGATVTPEVAVLVAGPAGRRLVYRGRIDDRAVEVGRIRPTPRVHDLEEVLDALTSGRVVEARTTAATGCFIAPRK